MVAGQSEYAKAVTLYIRAANPHKEDVSRTRRLAPTFCIGFFYSPSR